MTVSKAAPVPAILHHRVVAALVVADLVVAGLAVGAAVALYVPEAQVSAQMDHVAPMGECAILEGSVARRTPHITNRTASSAHFAIHSDAVRRKPPGRFSR
jgi:hypothetical protein